MEDEIFLSIYYRCLLDAGGRLECFPFDYVKTQWEPWSIADEVGLVPAGRYASVWASERYVCGIHEDGVSTCWGDGQYGTLDIPDGLEVASFSLGSAVACALDAEGYPHCWGYSPWVVQGVPERQFNVLGTTTNVACGWSEGDGWFCWGKLGLVYSMKEPTLEHPVEIQSGYGMCALDDRGRIECFGSLGNCPQLARAPSGEGWHDLSVGGFKACAFDAADRVHCWGCLSEPVAHDPPGEWAKYLVAQGGGAQCGVRPSGEVECLGCVFSDPGNCTW